MKKNRFLFYQIRKYKKKKKRKKGKRVFIYFIPRVYTIEQTGKRKSSQYVECLRSIPCSVNDKILTLAMHHSCFLSIRISSKLIENYRDTINNRCHCRFCVIDNTLVYVMKKRRRRRGEEKKIVDKRDKKIMLIWNKIQINTSTKIR